MKIALLAEDYPSPGRQMFVFVQQLVEALVDQGVDITVVAPQSLTRSIFRCIKLLPKADVYRTRAGNNYTVYRPFSISFGNGHKQLYKIAKAYNQSQINNVLENLKPEILYGHFWHTAYKLKDYAKKYNRPLFVACGEGDNALENLISTLSENEKSDFIDTVTGVISVSTENKRKCLAFGLCKEKNIIVLPNCVDADLFHPIDASRTKDQLNIKDSDFTIAFTGAFITRKGSKVVSEALNEIGDNAIKAIFIGKPLAGDDCTPIYDGIVHCGALDHDLIPEYLNCADVFVLPTLKEGCCNAIVEALACGVPVISSNRPFNNDLLNENNSIVVNPESVEEVANAIVTMKNNKELYAKKKLFTVANSNNYSIITRAQKVKAFIRERL